MPLRVCSEIVFEEQLSKREGRRTFGARLDRCLKRRNISSYQAAKLVGVTAQDVAFWRAGITAPERSTYGRLARMLEVKVSWLCLGIETNGLLPAVV